MSQSAHAKSRSAAVQREARSSDALAAALFESGCDAMLVVDEGGCITRVNAAACAMFGADPDGLTGLAIEVLVPEDARVRHGAWRTAFSRAPRSRAMGGVDLRARRLDGSEFPASISLAPVDLAGKSFVVAAVRDVSQERKARSALARRVRMAEVLAGEFRSDRLFAEIVRVAEEELSGTTCALLALDRGDHTLSIVAAPGLDPAFAQKIARLPFGEGGATYGAAAAQGRLVVDASIARSGRWAELRVAARAAGIRACWALPVVSTSGRVRGVLAVHHPRDHRPTDAEVAAAKMLLAPIALAFGRVEAEADARASDTRLARTTRRRTDALSREIARRAEVERELDERNDQLKAFAYTVSHDLKGPLRGITSYATEVVRRHAEPMSERGRFCAEQIVVAGKRLAAMIDDVLAYSRLERARVGVGPVDLERLLNPILEDLRVAIAENGTTIETDLAERGFEAWDVGLSIVLRNLVGNAVKFSRKSPHPLVRIASARSSEGIEIVVSDNGIGFEPEYHDRLFGLFSRLVRSEEYEGTGAGLAVAARAVARMGGRIRAQGSPGEGASFHVFLPLASPQSPAAGAKPQANGANHKSGGGRTLGPI